MPDSDDATMPTRIEQLEDQVTRLKGELTRLGHVLARYASTNEHLITENLRLLYLRERASPQASRSAAKRLLGTRAPRAD